jgi:hypothetical protein
MISSFQFPITKSQSPSNNQIFNDSIRAFGHSVIVTCLDIGACELVITPEWDLYD